MRRALAVTAAAMIAAYFFRFAQTGIRTGISHDDLMNIYFAWREPFSEILKANLFFPTNVIRPFGALFYAVWYHLFELNPVPYRLLCDMVLGLNIALTYWFSARVSGSREVGLLTALLHCVHVNFFPLYYGSGHCYDIFAFFFYYIAFSLVVRERMKGRYLSAPVSAAVAVLYACAVNSKESAASLPAMLLVFELLRTRPRRLAWIWQEGRGVLVTGCVGLAFLWARFTGPNNLMGHPAYTPVFRLDRYLGSTAVYLNDLSCGLLVFDQKSAALLLVVMVVIALALRNFLLVLACLLVIVGAAPIAFVAPRGLASYYIPLAGYALFLAVLMIYARERISRTAVARAAMFVLVFLCMWTWQWWQRRDLSSVSQEYAVISDAIRQIRSHPEWLRPNSEILIASDSFREEFEWASTFVTLLAAHDRSIRVYILRDADPKPGPGELRKYTTVIGYQNGTYVDLTDQARAQGL